MTKIGTELPFPMHKQDKKTNSAITMVKFLHILIVHAEAEFLSIFDWNICNDTKETNKLVDS